MVNEWLVSKLDYIVRDSPSTSHCIRGSLAYWAFFALFAVQNFMFAVVFLVVLARMRTGVVGSQRSITFGDSTDNVHATIGLSSPRERSFVVGYQLGLALFCGSGYY